MDYDVVRTSVINAYDKYKSADKKGFNQNMSDFYTKGKENPSVAHMILVDQLYKEGLKQSGKNKEHLDTFKRNSKLDTELLIPLADTTPVLERHMMRNLSELEMLCGIRKYMDAYDTKMTDELSEEVKPLKEAFDKEYEERYPKTHNIRKNIIENFGFSMNKTTPKLSYEDKIQLAEPKDGWKSIYPNSYENRCRLIASDRIGKSGKVSWLRKKFWDTTYLKTVDAVKFFMKTGIHI